MIINPISGNGIGADAVLLLTHTGAKAPDAGKSVQYVMYVGTNDKDTYKPEHSEEEATVYQAADEIIQGLNQNVVLIEENEITMQYYGGK